MPSAFFDIVGTCFNYDAAIAAVEERCGPKLAKYGLNSRAVFQFWLVTAERDSAYVYFTKRPKLVQGQNWVVAFPRVLFMAGVPPEDIDNVASKEDIDYMVQQYLWALTPAPGLREMLKTLEEGGIEFWCCSGASVKRVQNYFALAGIEFPEERIWDVTPVGEHKPRLPVYNWVMNEWQEKKPGEVMIFGASHSWDCAGAKTCGFETAYCTEYEHFENTAMWGKHDVVAPDLATLGKLMVEKWGTKA